MIHTLVPDGEFLKSLKVHGGQRGWKKNQGFRQTFRRLSRRMPVDREKGRRDLSMAHNVLDGTDRLLKFPGQEPRWLVMGTSARVSVEHNVSYHPYEIDSVTPID